MKTTQTNSPAALRPRSSVLKPIPALVTCTGPEPTVNKDGATVPTWFVTILDKDGEPAGRIYKIHDRWKAKLLAAIMADDRKLELKDKSSPFTGAFT